MTPPEDGAFVWFDELGALWIRTSDGTAHCQIPGPHGKEIVERLLDYLTQRLWASTMAGYLVKSP